MTNIPKKLSVRSYGAVDFSWFKKYKDEMVPNAEAHEEVINKINELIDYLQDNKPVGCCCIKKHSTGEVSKKDKYLCYTCNQWGIVGEHECEASKGERESIECLKEKVKKNIIDHSHAIYEELYPPEHEEIDVDKLYSRGMDRLRLNNYIRDNFVSKEKIKRELGEMEVPPENLHASCEENTRYFDWVNQGHAGYLDKNSMRQKLINSLGLGD